MTGFSDCSQAGSEVASLPAPWRVAAAIGLRTVARSMWPLLFYIAMLSGCSHSVASSPVQGDARAAGRLEAARAFEGEWAYAQSCGWRHSANIELAVTAGGRLQGAWADGTRVRGDSGQVRATVRGEKAFLSFCRNSVQTVASDVCTDYGPESAYLVRNGERLDWFRGSTKIGFKPYLSLHRVIAGQEIPKDDTCPEESDDG
jgi:hypothetical protein